MPKVRFRLYLREAAHERWGAFPNNVEVCVLRWPPKRLWSQLRLVAEIVRHRTDILFFPSSAIPWWCPGLIVTTIHDVAFERFPELYRSNELRFQRWALHRA